MISTSPAVAVVSSSGSPGGLYLLFQTRCLLFLLLFTPPHCISLGRAEVTLSGLVCFVPFSGAMSGITPASLLRPQFSSSVSSSRDESECLGIPKECVAGKNQADGPSPSLRYGPGLVADSNPAFSSYPGSGLPCLGQIRGLSAGGSRGGMVSGDTGPLCPMSLQGHLSHTPTHTAKLPGLRK